jgi:hypothetical protein
MYQFEIAFSRFIDYAILYLVGVWISFLSPVYIDPVFYLIYAVFLPFLWAPLEVFCMHHLKTTPGGWLFGIQFKSKVHHYRRLKQALWREKREGTIEIKGGKKRLAQGFVVSTLIVLGGLFSPILFQGLTSGYVPPTAKGWKHFHSPVGAFGIDFPAEPYHVMKELVVPIVRDPIPYNEYKSFGQDDSAITYAVSFLHLPLRVRIYGDNTVLKACLNFLPENGPTAKVLSQELVPYRKYPSLKYTLRTADEETQGRLIIANGKLFKVNINYPEGTDPEALHSATFLDSFHLRRR